MSAATFASAINPRENTIVFTIGRMNPPTSGHMELIKTLMEKAYDLKEKKIYIILSHSQDSKKNPLKCSRKRELLTTEGMINKIKTENQGLKHIEVNIRCMDDPVDEDCGTNPILKQICQIRKEELNVGRMILVIGEDRGYNWIKKSLSSLTPPVLLDIEVVARPEGGISATLMRGLVTSGTKEDEDKFIEKSINNGLSREDAQKLYIHLTDILGPAAFDLNQKRGTKRRAPQSSSKVSRRKTTKIGGKRKGKGKNTRKGKNKCKRKNKCKGKNTRKNKRKCKITRKRK